MNPFQAQNHRELSFKKGDLIYIRRQVDNNWYEGERNAMIGILPVSYVEIVPAVDSNTLQSRCVFTSDLFVLFRVRFVCAVSSISRLQNGFPCQHCNSDRNLLF